MTYVTQIYVQGASRFFTPSRPAQRPTQPPTWWVPVRFRVRDRGVALTTHHPTYRTGHSYTSTPPCDFMAVCRVNMTFTFLAADSGEYSG